MLIRSMAPQVIAVDEISSKEDAEAIEKAFTSGVKGIFTAHGLEIRDVFINKALKRLTDNYTLERIIFLNPSGTKGNIGKIYILDKAKLKYVEV